MARISLPALAQLPAEAHHSGIREIGNEALRTPGAIRLDVDLREGVGRLAEFVNQLA